jgi:endonuclease/exonuclease/phosphatase family metal-dependent hydrolase
VNDPVGGPASPRTATPPGPFGRLGEALGLTWYPALREQVPVLTGGAPARGVLAPGEPFRLTTWNIQYAGGRRHFFYDGGHEVHVPVEEARATLADILAEALEGEAPPPPHGPDFVLLQEVDRDSQRTGRIDELAPFLPHVHAAVTTPYQRSRFIPVPVRDPVGRVQLDLATLSRRPVLRATRHALPLLREPAIRQAFNLKRAILHLEVPLADGRTLAIANTHLSAFSGGDGTLPAQVEVLRAWMQARVAAGEPFVVAGDFNLLPPGDDPERLPDADQYRDAPNPLLRLAEVARSAIPFDELLARGVRTYQPFGSPPDRVLDYIFVSPDIEVVDAGAGVSDASDHLPLCATLQIVR